MTLWSGRFEDGPAPALAAFTDSLAVDQRLAPEDLAGSRAHVRGLVRAGLLDGDPTDVAHVLLALAQGLAAQETAGWLGTTAASRDRRWALATSALLSGLAPAAPRGARRGPRSARPTPAGGRPARR